MNRYAVLSSFALAATSMFGCASEIQDGDLDTTQQAAVVGNWVGSVGRAADGAFLSGPNKNLPVCRAIYDGGYHPGKVWLGACLYEFGGQGKSTSSFDTLVNQGYSWVDSVQPQCYWWGCQYNIVLPQNVIDGGAAGVSANNEHTYVCEAFYSNDWHPGKFWKNECLIEYAGKGVRVRPDYFAQNVKFAVR